MKTELYITLYSQIKETLIHSSSIQIELGVELLSSNGHQTSLCHVQSNKVCPIEMMYDLSIGSTFSPLSIMSEFDRTNCPTELMPTCRRVEHDVQAFAISARNLIEQIV